MLHTEFDFTIDTTGYTLPFLVPLLLHTLEVDHLIAQNTLRIFLGTESTNIAQITKNMSCIRKHKNTFPLLANGRDVAIEVVSTPTKALCKISNCNHADRCPIPAILHDRSKLANIPQVIREKLNV